MNGEKILRAITDIDDDFIIKAADDEYVKNVFRQLRKKPPVRVNMRKMIIAAIIIVLIIIISVFTALSLLFNINENMYDYNPDSKSLVIDINEIDRTADSYSLKDNFIAESLEANGLSQVTIPSAFLEEEWRLSEIEYSFCPSYTVARLEFEKKTEDGKKIIAYVTVSRYNNEAHVNGGHINYPERGTMLRVNGMDVFVFDLKRQPYAKYFDNMTVYSLGGDVSYEELLEIAETIY